jgi:hypothetical protein
VAVTDAPKTGLALLREPFKPEELGKLPRVTCRDCQDSQSRNCPRHEKQRCPGCKAWITVAHTDLDFVGHADVTNRLLDADSEWTWEPVPDPASLGLPCAPGGMWIRLTVCGVTRLGYGDAPGKKAGDAVKEVIGDALRNAAMRFGVALHLWAKGDRQWSEEGDAGVDAEQHAEEQARRRTATPLVQPDPAAPPPAAAPSGGPVDQRSAEQVEVDETRAAVRQFVIDRRWNGAKVERAFRKTYGLPSTAVEVTAEQLASFLRDLQLEAKQEDEERETGQADQKARAV